MRKSLRQRKAKGGTENNDSAKGAVSNASFLAFGTALFYAVSHIYFCASVV